MSRASKGEGFVAEQRMSRACLGVVLFLSHPRCPYTCHACWLSRYACRLYNFYVDKEGCWCSNDASAGNLVNVTKVNDTARVGYSEC